MTEEGEYNNIDFRINLLFDAVYNKSNTECYVIDPIIKKNITLLDLKEPDDFDKAHIFEGNFKYLETVGNKKYFKRNTDSSHPTTVIIEPYTDKNSNNNNMENSKILYNTLCHYVLSEITINEEYRHVILPIMFFD